MGTINTKHGTDILRGRTLNALTLRSEVKVTHLSSALLAWVCMSKWLLRFLVKHVLITWCW